MTNKIPYNDGASAHPDIPEPAPRPERETLTEDMKIKLAIARSFYAAREEAKMQARERARQAWGGRW